MKRSININQILALFIALFVVTAFSACSDVAGPDSSIDETSEITSEEYNETEIIRRRFGASGESTNPPSCTLSELELAEGSLGNRTTLGTVTPRFHDGELILYIVLNDDPDYYEIREAKGYVGTNAPTSPGDLDVDGTISNDQREATVTLDLTQFVEAQTIHVAVKAQVFAGSGGDVDDFSATAGDNNFHQNQFSFTLTYGCPSFYSAG